MARVGQQPAIIFDFDDTLVCSHRLFRQTEQQFCQRMQELGLYDEGLLAKVQAQDIANVEAAGHMAADCFARALAQTYAAYCQKFGRTPVQEEEEGFINLGHQPYVLLPPPMPGAHELLREISAHYGGYRRLLFTQGETELQRRRVEDSGFAEYFDVIEIVQTKNRESLSNLLQKEQVTPKSSWYIGNSLRADINPAIALGLNAVHLDIDSWSYEHQQPQGAYHTITELGKFVRLL